MTGQWLRVHGMVGVIVTGQWLRVHGGCDL